MKIRTEQDVAALDQAIKQKLGIDVQKYRDEAVLQTFLDLLNVPEYLYKWLARPIGLAILLFVVGLFLLNLNLLGLILYFSIGFFLFMTTGVFTGFLMMIKKIQSDVFSLLSYSLEIMKSAVADLNHANDQVTPENRKEVFGLLFKGIIHLLTIPTMTKVLSERVPLIGTLISGLIKKALTTVANKVKFDETGLKEELQKEEGTPSAFEEYATSITAVSKNLDKVVNFSFGTIQVPLVISLGLSSLSLLCFLYFVH